MESPSEEENSLGSLLAAIEQEAERRNSPPRQSQEETDVEPTDSVHSSRLHDDVEGIDIFVDLVLERGSQKVPVPVYTDVLQLERIPQTFSCADQQLPVDSEDPRPKRIPAEVSSQENDPPATSNANSPGNPQPPSVGIGCLPNEQTVEVITVDNVPVTSNTSSESLHGGPTAQARGQPSVVGRPPLPPAAATRGTARGRGRAGQTPARQVIGSGSSRGTKRSAGGVVVPFADAGSGRVSQQAQGDDDDTDVWADFAEYQARAAANAKNNKWEEWKRQAFRNPADIAREKAETTARIIAEEKAQWDAIVATFLYGAKNKFDDRFGFMPPRFVPIPKSPPDPPRPRTPPHVQIERIKAEYAAKTRDRCLGYQPTCSHELAWTHCPLCRKKPLPPLMSWTDEDLVARVEQVQYYADYHARNRAEEEARKKRQQRKQILKSYRVMRLDVDGK
ncbi:hypothetical protein R1sor_026596 [Riccia sorocarpa]|uniref:Uncharacterized protein n=1 Tax=Riccia sorocarpa TaxID=122646 RepID=A0ABD3GBT9_9MARC